MNSILIICLAVLLLVTLFLGYKCYKFSLIILSLENQIEESLDILEERHNNMTKILEKDVFFDSVEVRQVIEDIRVCHGSIILVANKLTQNFLEENEIKEKNNND